MKTRPHRSLRGIRLLTLDGKIPARVKEGQDNSRGIIRVKGQETLPGRSPAPPKVEPQKVRTGEREKGKKERERERTNLESEKHREKNERKRKTETEMKKRERERERRSNDHLRTC